MKTVLKISALCLLLSAFGCKKSQLKADQASDSVAIASQLKGSSAGSLEVAPTPAGWSNTAVAHLTESDDFDVEVKKTGATDPYLNCFVYKTDNYATTINDERRRQTSYSFTNFQYSGTAVYVTIHVLTATFPTTSNVVIRPLSSGIVPTINTSAKTISFTLSYNKYYKLSVEVGGRTKPLFLFAETPDVAPANAIHVTSGVHILSSRQTLASNDTLYLDPGAVVQGNYRINSGSSRILVMGRGLITNGNLPTSNNRGSGPGDLNAIAANATFNGRDTYGETVIDHITWQGITIVNSGAVNFHFVNTTHASNHNTWKNLKIMAWNGETDGIWYDGDDNTIDDCFIANNDDLTTTRGSNRATLTNLVLWGGNNGGRIFYHDDYGSSDGITYTNINVIGMDKCGRTIWVLHQSNNNTPHPINNVQFNNMRIEEHLYANNQYAYGKLIEFSLYKNTCSNWVFNNLTMDDQNPDEGDLYGALNAPVGIQFNNLKIKGNVITTLAGAHMDKNSYATTNLQ